MWRMSSRGSDLPFTRRQLRAAGHDAALPDADYHQVIRGVWVKRSGIDQDTLIRAALLIHPDAACASPLSAAAVHGLPVPDRPFVHVTVFRDRDRRFRPEIKPHVTHRELKIVVKRGIRVTNLVDTFIACAGMLSLVDLVILGDAMVRRYDITADQLRHACAVSGDYYAGLARNGAACVRDGVDSPMETRLRMLIVLAGLPEPEVDHRLYNDDGTWRRRFDLYYPGLRLIIEYDGLHHLEDDQWEADIDRREELDDEGYRVLVVTARGIFKQPERTLRRIQRQIQLLGGGAVPLRSTWRDHFAA